VFNQLLSQCAARGVDVKWFGAEEPKAFTSRYDSWAYLGEPQQLPQTLKTLSNTCDIRVPLTFETRDCAMVARIVCEEVEKLGQVTESKG